MVVAMAIVDPEVFQSGTSVFKSPQISKKGNNPLRDFYYRLIGHGKPKMKALVAAMRKILVWA